MTDIEATSEQDSDDAPQIEDIEDVELLDETGQSDDEVEPVWEKHRRELLTSVLDYNLNTLSDLVNSKQIDLSPRYQRRDRWKPERQSRLIESFFMNVPVPPIFLNEDDYGKYSVIDGKQRLTAIHEFMRGRLRLKGLKVFSELNDKTIDDLSANLRAIIGTRANLRATIILRQSDKEVKFEVFRRLNTGGVSLNPQEIRNSTWPGPLNEMLLNLSENSTYRRMLGITKPGSSMLYKEMRDVELVLRFLTFRKDWATFSGGMSKRLDQFMADNQRVQQAELNKMENAFLSTLEVVEQAFGEHAFRRFNPETKTWRRPILAALFDAQMFAAMNMSKDDIQGHEAQFAAAYEQLFSNGKFRQSIDAATNTPALFRSRIEIMQSVFAGII